MNHPQIIIPNYRTSRIWPAGYNLYKTISVPFIIRHLEQPVIKKQIFSGRIIPVQHKSHRQRCHCSAFYTNMSIPPISKFFISPQIFSPYIKSPDESKSPVDHNNFPVVPVIHAKLELPKNCWKKLRSLYSFCFKTYPVCPSHSTPSPAPHTVKKNTNLDSLPCLTN